LVKNKIKALLIDIDDTITKLKSGFEAPHPDRNLMRVLEKAGIELAGLSPAESAKRVAKVKDTLRWWVWEDFIEELGLDHERFWEYAYRIESAYLEAAGPEIKSALRKLWSGGGALYITSNNPVSGIRHKLRLAGFARDEISDWFSALFGVSELEVMKWDVGYWKKVVSLSGFSKENLCTVGDSLHDDYEVPSSVGIGHAFIVLRNGKPAGASAANLTYVTSFDEIAAHLAKTARRTG
jgi:FMN phosphatase YigB (HAD superfamily)